MSDQTDAHGSSTEASTAGLPLAALGTIPALAALAVGLLYAVGALERATQLHGAHLRILDFLPLTPLQDLLATGISQTVQYSVGVAYWTLAFALALWFSRTHPGPGEPEEPTGDAESPGQVEEAAAPRARVGLPGWARDWVLRPLYRFALRPLYRILYIAFVTPVSYLLFFVFYCTLYSFTGAAAVTLGLWASSGWVSAALSKQRRRALAVLTILVTGTLAFGLIGSYFDPQPLPVTTLRTTGGVLHGRLVAHVDRFWYISTAPNRVISIPDGRIHYAVTVSQKHRRPRTGWQIVRSWF